jgi:hypothetical protein
MPDGISWKGPLSIPVRRAAGWAAVPVLALASTAALLLFLRYLLQCEREGKRTLYQLSAPITALTWVGDRFGRFATAHWAALLVISLVLLGAAASLRRQQPLSMQSRYLLAGLMLLAASAAFFLGRRYAPACICGIAGAAALWRGGWLDLAEAGGGRSFLLVLPVALGAALRFYSLEEVPGGVATHAIVHHLNWSIPYKDTLLPMLRAGHFLDVAGRIGSILRGEHFGLMSLLAGLGFEVLGVSFLSARLLSAVAGTLTVAMAYFMGRELEDERTGLLFSFLVAVSPWHLTVSRYSDLEHVLSPLQLVVALALYGAAFRTGRLTHYALAGVALGLSWYVYAPNQVLPLIIALHLGAMAAFRRGFLRRDFPKLAVFLLLFAAVANGPIRTLARGRFHATTGYDSAKVSLGDLPRHGRMIRAAGRQLFVATNDEWFAKPGGGLSLTEASLLLPGLLLAAASLLRPERRWASALVLLALPISLIPGLAAPDESFRRFYPTATLALFVAACTLSRSLEAARRVGLRPRAIAAAGSALLAVVACVNADVYFNRSSIHTEEGAAVLTETAKLVKESAGKEYVYVFVTPGSEPGDFLGSIRFATYEQQREWSRQGRGPGDFYRLVLGGELLSVLEEPQRLNGRTRFLAEVVPGGDRKGVDACAAITRAHPEAEEETYRNRRGRAVLRSWRISRP